MERLLVISIQLLLKIQEIQKISDEDLVKLVQQENPEFSLDILCEIIIENTHLIFLEDICNELGVNFIDILQQSNKIREGGTPVMFKCLQCNDWSLVVFTKERIDIISTHCKNFNIHEIQNHICNICRG